MIDPTDPPDVQIAKQAKIIEALTRRAERGHGVGRSAYSMFQSAIALQTEVWEKTRDLEEALDTLGRASSELELAYRSQERMQKSLSDAMAAVEGGFALFTDDRLEVCNDHFRSLLPDVEPLIVPGLSFDEYLGAVAASKFLRRRGAEEFGRAAGAGAKPRDRRFSNHVLALKNDRWFQISYRQTGSGNVAVLQTEITDVVRQNRREKNRLIDRQAHLLQAAFDHLPLGVCTFSGEGELMLRNERFGELLGVPLSLLKKGTGFRRIAEHVGRFEVLQQEGEGGGLASWFKTVRRGGVVQERFRRPDGVSLDVQIHALPDEEGFIVAVTDITTESEAAEERLRINQILERRVEARTAELTEANRLLQHRAAEQARVEEALRLAKEAAEDAHRSKTRFLAAASHDLLQPINAAKLYISTLRETLGPARARDMVDRLGRSFTSIESLLHALLDISRLDSVGPEFSVTSFSLGPVLHSLAEDIAPLAAEKGIVLTILPSSVWVTSDQRYLLRSIQNLVVNAIEYTESGRVLVGCRRNGNQVRVEVWDTGIGISENDIERIFSEFTRVSETRSATRMGLGLSIVERACRHLGHKVDVRSTPGKGSVFSITLPREQVEQAVRSELEVEEPAQEGGLDLIVMVVENDVEVLHAMTTKLDSWGASVLAAASTAEAIKLMDEIGAAPDIILADYHLDGSDTGVEAIRALRGRADADIPAIIITADRSDRLTQHEAEMGISVLTKPVKLSRLRALMNWKTRRSAA